MLHCQFLLAFIACIFFCNIESAVVRYAKDENVITGKVTHPEANTADLNVKAHVELRDTKLQSINDPTASSMQQQPNELQGIVQSMKSTELHTDKQITSTFADILCRGQNPETVIPLEMGRKFVVCLYDGYSVEQSCPRGLYYNNDTRRCERKSDPVRNPCASHPCLNGGQCIPTDTISYRCQCPFGLGGDVCELDVYACETLKPCGKTSDSRCQSFRLDAALKYVCICNQNTLYGLNCQEVHDNPCQGVNGTHLLTFSEKGFAMCDGENTWVESCPGGTIWDQLNVACVWPDMKGLSLDTQEQT
ncbi:unnamed protein product [Adineta ricciae]|uniref:Uncharacterized protein n=1 Tax=Adineta ricciae TaxID=249248 RepID=A0A816FSA5_ADIRI|nr:unnamed protein product [Adineta ricciae]CAF1665503.1 unnamed protein product [Adineta ricciae]